ncbi:MAG: alginate export family protein [Bacteroidota bacterium]
MWVPLFKHLYLILLCGMPIVVVAQHQQAILDERAKEDYSYLKDSTNLAWQKAIKYLGFGAQNGSYISVGGSYRARYEHFTNRFWVNGNNQNYYTQRISFHLDLHLGSVFRTFVELQSGYKTGEIAFLQNDDIDFHQLFIELKTGKAHQFSTRIGRQEMKLGAGRLVDIRVGPNVRRSFDLAQVAYQHKGLSVKAFYGEEVDIFFKRPFDNTNSLFSENANSPTLWGVFSNLSLKEDKGSDCTELYYLGFRSGNSAFSDVEGEETRHSIGLRRAGFINKRFQFNSELIFQFGDLAGNTIRAFNFETDWKYTFPNTPWKPMPGIKLDWSSGDRNPADGKLNSFNPMFVNPATYSLAAVNTPVNLLSFHPSLTLFPAPKFMINLEYALFFRTSEDDGFYSPPRLQSRTAETISSEHIGDVLGLFFKYTHSRYIQFDIRSSFFLPGDFIEDSGPSASIFQLATTLTLIL